MSRILIEMSEEGNSKEPKGGVEHFLSGLRRGPLARKLGESSKKGNLVVGNGDNVTKKGESDIFEGYLQDRNRQKSDGDKDFLDKLKDSSTPGISTSTEGWGEPERNRPNPYVVREGFNPKKNGAVGKDDSIIDPDEKLTSPLSERDLTNEVSDIVKKFKSGELKPSGKGMMTGFFNLSEDKGIRLGLKEINVKASDEASAFSFIAESGDLKSFFSEIVFYQNLPPELMDNFPKLQAVGLVCDDEVTIWKPEDFKDKPEGLLNVFGELRKKLVNAKKVQPFTVVEKLNLKEKLDPGRELSSVKDGEYVFLGELSQNDQMYPAVVSNYLSLYASLIDDKCGVRTLDIKGSTVVVDNKGRIKFIDTGIAKVIRGSGLDNSVSEFLYGESKKLVNDTPLDQRVSVGMRLENAVQDITTNTLINF